MLLAPIHVCSISRELLQFCFLKINLRLLQVYHFIISKTPSLIILFLKIALFVVTFYVYFGNGRLGIS